MLVKETLAMNEMSLNTAILSFAFSGVLPRHKRDYEAPRPASAETAKKKA